MLDRRSWIVFANGESWTLKSHLDEQVPTAVTTALRLHGIDVSTLRTPICSTQMKAITSHTPFGKGA
jgi:hypothetical protein